MKYNFQLFSLAFFSFIYPTTIFAQVTPDASLGTTVTPNQLINGILSERIDSGVLKGSNLFHSFQEFNINVGKGVYFTNPTGVTNIFTRVTGVNPSNINGRLGVDGNANLLFMNPQGIVFGKDASLDIKGSFLGTTANSINFTDGTQFSAIPGQVNSILTVSVPVGLGFGSNTGEIIAQGTGHKLTTTNSDRAAYSLSGDNTGLRVQPNKTLALVGGNITLNGMVLTAPGGRIELGSVGSGVVNLNPENFALDYAGSSNFQDIKFQQKALADVSNITAGSIQVQGRQISLTDGSVLWSQNRGSQTAGSIRVNASESLLFSGDIPSTQIRSGLVSETLKSGIGGNIQISTQRLISKGVGGIYSRTFGSGTGGETTVNASESIELSGFIPGKLNTISALTLSEGKAGNVTVSTPQLSLSDGAIIASATYGSGSGGSLVVNAENINLIGNNGRVGALSATSFSYGNAGNITVNTRNLTLTNGSVISTSNFGTADAGSITINASESVKLSGINSVNKISSRIRSSVTLLTASEVERRALGLPNMPSGKSGAVTINTPNLTLAEKAFISVANDGIGKGGNLSINADSVSLDTQASLLARTVSGSGGDINLTANTLQLRRGSSITTNAGTAGNGGSINLNASALTLLENSKISANAGQGRGGNITIDTQGLFQSSDSTITATGTFSNGEIRLINPDIKQDNSLQQQSTNFVATDNVVVSSCLVNKNQSQGRFVVTGNGGLAESPGKNLELSYNLIEVTAVNTPVNTLISNASPQQTSIISNVGAWKIGDTIVEATELLKTQDGRLLLQATATNPTLKSSADCITSN